MAMPAILYKLNYTYNTLILLNSAQHASCYVQVLLWQLMQQAVIFVHRAFSLEPEALALR